MTELARLYLDFDSFFASAEQHFNPQLRGKPLGVVPLDVPTTGCIAISKEAKRAGVPSGASVETARAACEDMIFVVARPDAYVRLHRRILNVIESVLPVETVKSIDEVVCHLNYEQAADPHALAKHIKNALADAFSGTLTCSIGIAASGLQAKIAAELEKPDGLVVIRDDDMPGRIAHLALRDIPGISSGIETRLANAGITTIPTLWAMERKHARALWGSIEGERFWCELHGENVDRPETTKRMFGHSRMLPPDWRTPDKIHDCARQLMMGAARRLRRSEFAATKLTLSARGGGYRDGRGSKPDDRRWSKELVFRPVRDDRALLAHLREAAQAFAQTATFKPRSIGVVLHGLEPADAPQADLFGEATESGRSMESRQRDETLSSVLDQLRAAYGPNAASIGMPVEVPGGYLGAKIAFGRIPDDDDFNENPTEDHATHYCTSF